MSKEIRKFTEPQLRELFSRLGLKPEDINNAIQDYYRYRESELKELSILTYRELIAIGEKSYKERLKDGIELVGDIINDYLLYSHRKNAIAKTYQESKDWREVFSKDVYSDDGVSPEAFIDYVEEIYQTKVKDAKHLQKLTGITHLTGSGDKIAKTEEEGKTFAINELEETIMNSRYSKYARALNTAITDGAKYKDLLQIKPKDYGLPETWKDGGDQYSSILWAIGSKFSLIEPGGLMIHPDLRSIAKELEAPYSLIMDAHKGATFQIKRDIESKMKDLERRLKRDIRAYIDKQPATWKKDRMLIAGKSWSKEKADSQVGDYVAMFIVWFKIVLFSEIQPDKELDDYDIAVIKEHKETIYKEFKKYLEEAIKLYSLSA